MPLSFSIFRHLRHRSPISPHSLLGSLFFPHKAATQLVLEQAEKLSEHWLMA
jgi:hypothetical protein